MTEVADDQTKIENQVEQETESDNVERLENEITEESKNNSEENETTEEDIKKLRNSDNPPEVKFNLELNEEIQDDSELPPLPPPKKLLKYKIPPILQPVPKENIRVPPEIIGQGINKKVS